jgi:putative ABC transport system substrate-binding protein
MKTRREFLVAGSAGLCVLASPLSVRAQQTKKIWRIGYLDLGSHQSLVDSGRHAALLRGLREQGYVEGRNIVLDARHAGGNVDRLDGYAADLVRGKADLILIYSNAAGQAAKRATGTIPIVVIGTFDPVGNGLAASLARPGGNLTGMTSGNEDTIQKLVELLIVAVPKLKRIAVLTNPATSVHARIVPQVETTARQAGRQILPVSARTPEDVERGFATAVRGRADAVIVLADSFLFQQRAQIAGLALKHKLPSIYPQQQYAEAGGLMSYGADANDSFRRAGIFVDKILKGAKPGDIPFELPMRYYFMINRKTANALGVKLTNELLARADKVIE